MTVWEEKKLRLYRNQKRTYARQLRLSPTPTEQRLWIFLRDRRLLNCKFRRQVAMGPYIVDFVCRKRRLIVEIDGEIHAARCEYDAERDSYFADRRYRVLHISREDVEKRLGIALRKIRETLL